MCYTAMNVNACSIKNCIHLDNKVFGMNFIVLYICIWSETEAEERFMYVRKYYYPLENVLHVMYYSHREGILMTPQTDIAISK